MLALMITLSFAHLRCLIKAGTSGRQTSHERAAVDPDAAGDHQSHDLSRSDRLPLLYSGRKIETAMKTV
jgi:hypothetical protein